MGSEAGINMRSEAETHGRPRIATIERSWTMNFKNETQDTLTSLICRWLRDSGNEDEVMARLVSDLSGLNGDKSHLSALSALRGDGEQMRSRLASIKLARSSIIEAMSSAKKRRSEKEEREEEKEDEKEDEHEEIIETKVQEVLQLALDDEGYAEEVFEGEDVVDSRTMGLVGKGEDKGEDIVGSRMITVVGKGGEKGGEDVTGKGGDKGVDKGEDVVGQQRVADVADSLPPSLAREQSYGTSKCVEEKVELQRVVVERLTWHRPISTFYQDQDVVDVSTRHPERIELVRYKNRCQVYTISDAGERFLLGSFHADDLVIFEQGGFEVNLKLASDTHDGEQGRRDRRKRRKSSSSSKLFSNSSSSSSSSSPSPPTSPIKRRNEVVPVRFLVEDDQRKEYMAVFNKMRKGLLKLLGLK